MSRRVQPMEVVFRPWRPTDPAKWRRSSRPLPTVVTVDGTLVLAVVGGEVLFQDGSEGVADLIRALRSVERAQAKGVGGSRLAEAFERLFSW